MYQVEDGIGLPLFSFFLMPILIKNSRFFCRCDRLNSCRVPVSSDLFGDPCPETHKYVEIHYTCAPTDDSVQQRPPWYIHHPSLNGSSLLPPLPWLKDDIRSSDLPKNGGGGASAPRIPILVATTTSTPKRIPITSSPPPPTTTATTLKTTTASPIAVVLTTAGKGLVGGDSTKSTDEDEYIGDNDEDGLRDELAEENVLEEDGEEGRLVESSLVDMREQGEEGEGGDYCRPSLARNLYWQQTPRGQPHVQPCPNGATGSARWLCSHHQVCRRKKKSS
jgi:latrophilin 1